MSRNYTVIVEKDEEGWLVSEVVELPGCHTQAKTLDQLMERTKEAITAYLEGYENGETFLQFVDVKKIKV
ncbi:MAG TPA: type II toxin-antitoxin system HicB family antitoxin [archaeon]|nr:type II toxin-antitoxin system HicB family antitoxin [archaeon]